MNIYNFSFKEFLSREALAKLVTYYIEHDKLDQQELISKLPISQASYFRSKKKGFLGSDQVLDELAKYYGITESCPETIDLLSKKISELYTKIHFAEDTENIHQELKAYIEQCKNNPAIIPLLIGLNISMALQKYNQNEDFIDSKIDLLEYFCNSLKRNDNNYILSYSLEEYYLQTGKINNALTHIDEMEALLPNLDEGLQFYDYYICMLGNYLRKNYTRALVFANKCINLSDTYYSAYIMETLRQNVIVFNLLLENYEMVIKYASSECLHLQYEEKYTLQYITSLTNLATAHLKLNHYIEAIELYKSLLLIDIDNTNVVPAYKTILKEKQTIFPFYLLYSYYKSNNMDSFDTYLSSINKDESPDEMNALYELLEMLKSHDQKSMSIFKTKLKELEQISLQKLGYRVPVNFLRDEYKNYLISKNKLKDILDM